MKEKTTSDPVEQLEVDLIVAGAGAGGMTAALVASLEGLDVLLLETSDQVGGTIWLNHAVAVGVGWREPKAVLYEIFEIL